MNKYDSNDSNRGLIMILGLSKLASHSKHNSFRVINVSNQPHCDLKIESLKQIKRFRSLCRTLVTRYSGKIQNTIFQLLKPFVLCIPPLQPFQLGIFVQNTKTFHTEFIFYIFHFVEMLKVEVICRLQRPILSVNMLTVDGFQ